MEVVLSISPVFGGIVIDQLVALEPAPLNISLIFVTLEVSQEERSREKVVALKPAK